tara:strand:+ start:7117 stop:7848 length:732 start_codon:yes stop_codon:yes gene_type:complete
MISLGFILGTAADNANFFEREYERTVETPFGLTSTPLIFGKIDGLSAVFLKRHGADHQLLPHEINYRANIWALKQLNISNIISINSVGGINRKMLPGRICLPDQIIDYTYNRNHTYPRKGKKINSYIDFTEPYCDDLMKKVGNAAEASGVPIIYGGTYGATQGPRLESKAEIKKLSQDGCDIVGMTGMPEASLALELGICYASISVIVNWAAGVSESINLNDIEANMRKGEIEVKKIIRHLRI